MRSVPELPIRVSSPFVPVINLPLPLLLLPHTLSGGGGVAVTRHLNEIEGP